jgi:hypothetical protein
MTFHPECDKAGSGSAKPDHQYKNREERIHAIAVNPRLKSRYSDTLCLRRICAGIGAVIFIWGLFIPSVQYISPGAPVSVFGINPLFSTVYLVCAVIALVLILLHYSMVPRIIGTLLGSYLIMIAIPALLNGTLDVGFGVMVTGDILLIVGPGPPDS